MDLARRARNKATVLTDFLSRASRPALDLFIEAGSPNKRALVSYITAPFRVPRNDDRHRMFSNFGIARSIVSALNRLGYAVDVVDWKDTRFVPQRSYDLYVGHGGINFERLASAMHASVPKIYFATGLYWQEHNRLERLRFEALETRRGLNLPFDRRITFSEEEALQMSDGIICLGNDLARRSYSGFPIVINIDCAAFPEDRPSIEYRDFAIGRNRFLFFAGPGNVHKGLDLALEGFAESTAELIICQQVEPAFKRAYRSELRRPNIHLVGWVPARSNRFYEIVDRCNFILSASCAEGSQGAVIECLHQGLVPVITPTCTIDVEEFGVLLNEPTPAAIREQVDLMRQESLDRHRTRARSARTAATSRYSDETFLQSFAKAVETAVNA